MGNVKNHEAQKRHGRPMFKLENNIKLDLKGIYREGAERVETLSEQSSVVGIC